MKRFISLILVVITIVTLLCACASQPIDETRNFVTQTPVPDTRENVNNEKDHFKELDEKFVIIGAFAFNGTAEGEFAEKYQTALDNQDADTVNSMLANYNQTMIKVKYPDGHIISDYYYDEIVFKNQKGIEVNIVILPYTTEFDDDMKEMKKVASLSYDKISGNVYKYNDNANAVYAFYGFINCDALVLVVSESLEELTAVVNRFEIIEPQYVIPVDYNEYKKTLNDTDYTFITGGNGVEVILTIQYMSEYDIAEGDWSVSVTNKEDTDDSFNVYLNSFDYAMEDMSKYIKQADIGALYKITTGEITGIVLINADSLIFYGVDIDSSTAIEIETTSSLDDLSSFIKSIDIVKKAYSAEK